MRRLEQPKGPQLLIPGQGRVSARVYEAMQAPILDHRSPEFHKLFQETTGLLKILCKTKNPVLILGNSGTMAADAVFSNTFSRGDEVLVVNNGYFGNSLSSTAQGYRLNVHRVDAKWGEAVSPDDIENVLSKYPNTKAVVVTHCETSTGVINPLEKIGAVVKKYPALLIVDAVSSIPAIDLPIDGWGCDIVFTASQKGWGSFAGLGMLSVSDKAWEVLEMKYKTDPVQQSSLDIIRARESYQKYETPFTPSLALIRALHAAMNQILAEGHDNFLIRHAKAAEMVQDSLESMGMKLLVTDKSFVSNTITVALTEQADRIKERARQELLEISGGLGQLEHNVLRIGHLGSFTLDEIAESLEVLKKVLI